MPVRISCLVVPNFTVARSKNERTVFSPDVRFVFRLFCFRRCQSYLRALSYGTRTHTRHATFVSSRFLHVHVYLCIDRFPSSSGVTGVYLFRCVYPFLCRSLVILSLPIQSFEYNVPRLSTCVKIAAAQAFRPSVLRDCLGHSFARGLMSPARLQRGCNLVTTLLQACNLVGNPSPTLNTTVHVSWSTTRVPLPTTANPEI